VICDAENTEWVLHGIREISAEDLTSNSLLSSCLA
jgi:hypothetical protein